MLIRRFDSRAFQALEKKKKSSKLQTGVPDGGSRRGFQTGISNGVPPRLMPILVPMTTLTRRANGGNYGPRRKTSRLGTVSKKQITRFVP